MPLVNLSQPQLDLLRELLGDHQDELQALAAKSAYLKRTVGEYITEADGLAELLASVSQGGTPGLESTDGSYGFVARFSLDGEATHSNLESQTPPPTKGS